MGLVFVLVAALVALVALADSPRPATATPGDPQQVVFANWNAGASPRICTNNGIGDFGGCQSIPVVGAATDASAALATGDFDEDGLLDLVIGMQNGAINLCIGSVADTWSCTAHGANARHRAAVVDDFDGDGNLDIVASIETQTNMAVCLGDGTGGLTCTQQWAPTGGGVLAAADVTGDGHVDIVYPADPGPTALCTNDGTAAFTCTAMTGAPVANGAALGDLDADGDLDIAFSSFPSAAAACLGNGAGAFVCSSFAGTGARAVGLADLDGDGNLDALLLNEAAPSQTCLGNGAGALTCQPITGIGALARSMDLADTDGDGDIDVVVGRAGDNQACVNDGAGDFSCIGSDNNTWHSPGTLVLDNTAPPPPPPPPADTDGDGLTDDDEINIHGTDPLSTDTDGDGLDDGDEVNVHGTDPTDATTDADSLTDGDEVLIHGTNPLLADTDGDGLGDGAEVNVHGTNPLSGDTDGDGLFDGDEVTTHGTDPLLVSTDGDGWSDNDELFLHGTDPLSADTDGDGLQDDVEFTYGTDPTNPNSDGDSLSDGDEVLVHGTDPTLTDTDGDGLGDGAEINVRGTDPLVADTDGDGLSDGAEVQVHGTDPLLVSTDGDSLSDGDEVNVHGTDPLAVDTDGDGLGDGAEVEVRGTDPLDADTDGDGLSDGDEVQIHETDPLDADTDDDGVDDGAEVAAGTNPRLPPGGQEIHLTAPGQRRFDRGPFEIGATADSGGAVELAASGTCTIAGTTVTPTGAGTCVLSADQAGGGEWLPAATVTHEITIAKGVQRIEWELRDWVPLAERTWRLRALATSGLPIGYTTSGPCRVEDRELSVRRDGTCVVSADQDGNADWLPATSVDRELAIGRADQTITFETPAAVGFGQPIELSATSTSGLPVAFVAAPPCSVNGSQLTSTAAGTCAVSAVRGGNERWFDAEPVHRQATITPATATLILTDIVVDAADAPAPVEVITDPAGLDGVTVTYAGEAAPPTEPGTYPMRAALEHPGYVAEPVSADYVVLEPPPFVPASYEARTITADQLVGEGLPVSDGDGLALTVTGFEPATVATARSGGDEISGTADTDGALLLVLPPEFDAAEATLEITAPDGTTAAVSTEDVIAIGDTLVEVVIEVGAGTDASAGDADELANTDEPADTDGAGASPGSVVVRATGLAPGGAVEVTVYSTPVVIGALVADDEGAVEADLALPGLEPGEHRIVLVGERDEGPVSGSWFFTVDESGAIDSVGDPEPEPEPEPAATDDADDTDEVAAASGDDAAPADLAAVQVDRGVDDTTGLPRFEPVDEPEQAVETGVTAFAMLAALSAGAGMTALAAMGSGCPAATAAAASGPTTGDGGDGEKGSRGKGKVASGKAKGLGDEVAGLAWGDRSPTWRWPATSVVDDLSRRVPVLVAPFSPLAARVAMDGSTLRGVFGSAAMVGPVLGVLAGLLAVFDTGGHAVPPALWLMIAIVLLGTFDAFAGLVAAFVFAVAVWGSGGVVSPDSVRTLMGVGSLWFAVPMIAGGVRPFRRPKPATWAERWTAVGAVIVGSLMGAWTVQGVVKSLPSLSGLDLPIAARADTIALVVLVALVLRYVAEALAVRAYPERLGRVTPADVPKPSTRQKAISTLFKGATFVFIVLPYIGMRWQLWAVAAMSTVPALIALAKDRFPNIEWLYLSLPRGIPKILVMMVIGTFIGEALGNRIDDPATLLVTAFVVLSIPGLVASLLDLVAREAPEPQIGWTGRIAGALVFVVTVATIRGHFGDSLAMSLLWVLPAAAWWVAAVLAHRRRGEAEAEADETDAAAEADADETPADVAPLHAKVPVG